MTDMTTPLDSRQKDLAGFYGQIKAHDTLLRLIALECQRRNPQFVQFCRRGVDIGLGTVRAETYPSDLEPFAFEIDVRMRTTIEEILENAEKAIVDLEKKLAAANLKPRTLRRRFLNWLERGW
jgi:hypothetical protein